MHAAPDGYLIPMVFLALPRPAVAGVIGTDVSSLLDAEHRRDERDDRGPDRGPGRRHDRALAVDGSVQSFVIAGIEPYAQVGGSDVVMTTDAAARLGAFDDTRMVIWGIDDRAALDAGDRRGRAW